MIRRLDLPEGQHHVDLRRFCEVICKASFPQCDLRCSLHGFDADAPLEDDRRCPTKELHMHLNHLHAGMAYSLSLPAAHQERPSLVERRAAGAKPVGARTME